MSRIPFRTGVAAGALVGLALAAPAAQAATPSHWPAPKHFVARGLVVAHTAHSVTVVARTLATHDGTHADRRIVVHAPAGHGTVARRVAHALQALHTGDSIALTGTTRQGGSGTRFTAGDVTAHSAPFHVYVGTVSAVSGNLVTLSRSRAGSDDETEADTGAFVVDVTNATVTVDGSPGVLAVGQRVAVLGSSVDDVVVATSAFGFSTAPSLVSGRVTAITGSVATVRTNRGHGARSHGGGNGAATLIDLGSAGLVVDGTSNAAVGAVTVDSRILAVGTLDTAGQLHAALAFVFTHPCSSRHHGDGGDHQGDGSGDGNGDSGGGDGNGGGTGNGG